MPAADRLRQSVAHAVPRLLAHATPGRRPDPERWSPAETLGHLVDSALVNHGRLVRGPSEGLVFEGYDQDAWVEAARYAEAPWPDLVALWRLLNEGLARLLDAIPDDVLDREHAAHSLDRTAWQPVPADRPATLRDVADDYVGHLRHHLRRIDPALVTDG